jgi:hypothetical protein
LLHEATDNVGGVAMDLKTGEEIDVTTLEGKDIRQIKLVSDVPLGNKVEMNALALNKHILSVYL